MNVHFTVFIDKSLSGGEDVYLELPNEIIKCKCSGEDFFKHLKRAEQIAKDLKELEEGGVQYLDDEEPSGKLIINQDDNGKISITLEEKTNKGKE